MPTNPAHIWWNNLATGGERTAVQKVIKDALITLAVSIAEGKSVRDLESYQVIYLNDVLETIGLEPVTYKYKASVKLNLVLGVEIDADGASESSTKEAIEDNEFEGKLHDGITEAVANGTYTIDNISVEKIVESE